MANSPVDKSKDFIDKGMTLITEQSSDKYLNKSNKKKENKNECVFVDKEGEEKREKHTIFIFCFLSFFADLRKSPICGRSGPP